MAIRDDVRTRIYEAADKLLADSADGSLPTVDAVRQLSQANMNSVVEGMKDWRAKQRKQVQDIKEPLPAELMTQVQGLGQGLWESALYLANESLSAARTAFEAEKIDLQQLSLQQSSAFDRVSEELAAALEKVTAQDRAAEEHAEAFSHLETKGQELAASLSQALQDAAIANQKATEVERRAGELRQELDRAHEEGKGLRQAADTSLTRAEAAEGRADTARDALEAANRVIAQLREDLATAKGVANVSAEDAKRSAALLVKAEAEQEKARGIAAAAREETALLRGQLTANKAQLEKLEKDGKDETALLRSQLTAAAAQLAKEEKEKEEKEEKGGAPIAAKTPAKKGKP